MITGDALKADLAKKEAIKKLQALSDMTKGCAEFVIKIDMCLDAPIVNTGCVIPINDGENEQLWIVINMEEFGEFLTAKQILQIKNAIMKGGKKLLDNVKAACPTAVCVPCVPAVTMDMLKTRDTGEVLLAVHVMDAYLKNQHNRLRGQEINYCHFASRCHVYFNSYPAGLKAGTSIIIAGNKFTPHMLPMLKPEYKVYLRDLVPKRRELMLVTGGSNKQSFIGKPENFEFPEEHYIRMSQLTATVTNFVAIWEKQERKIVDASKATPEKKATKKKVAAKKTTSKKKK